MAESKKQQMFRVLESFASVNEIDFSGKMTNQTIFIGPDNYTHTVQFKLQWSTDHFMVYLVLKKEKRSKKIKKVKSKIRQQSQAIAALWNVSDIVQFLGAFLNLYELYAKRNNPEGKD